MRAKSYTALAMVASTMLLTPGSAPAAATKEMQDLQRDVAQLQDQLTQLQKSSDAKFAALQAQLQQALDIANKTNSGVNSMSTGVTQTIQSELRAVREQLNGVTGLSVKLDNTSNDVSDLKSALQSLLVTVNRQQAVLNDILNQVKLNQAAPVAPPPPAESAPGAQGAAGPPPTAQALFTSGVNDMNAGKGDLALSEFAEFLRLYPNDGNSKSVQFNIGDIHYNQPGKLDQAVKDFDLVIEEYSKDQVITPEAEFMKGMALKQLNRAKDAIAAFRTVVADFPRSDEAAKAKAQLNAMGANATAPKGRK